MSDSVPNSDFLLGGRTSASAECRHWSERAVRWSSCAIRLRPPPMTFPLGETIELQHDPNVIRQHRDLDLAGRPPRLSATTARRSSGALPM
jgi:hypothetical protein